MWIFFLEAGVALALLILIVWWTMPRRKGDFTAENAEDAEEGKDLK